MGQLVILLKHNFNLWEIKIRNPTFALFLYIMCLELIHKYHFLSKSNVFADIILKYINNNMCNSAFFDNLN